MAVLAALALTCTGCGQHFTVTKGAGGPSPSAGPSTGTTRPAGPGVVNISLDALGAGWTSAAKMVSVADLSPIAPCGPATFPHPADLAGTVLRAPSGQRVVLAVFHPTGQESVAALSSAVDTCSSVQIKVQGTERTAESDAFKLSRYVAYTTTSTTGGSLLAVDAYALDTLADGRLALTLVEGGPATGVSDAGLFTNAVADAFEKSLTKKSYGPIPALGNIDGDPLSNPADEGDPGNDVPPVGYGTTDPNAL